MNVIDKVRKIYILCLCIRDGIKDGYAYWDTRIRKYSLDDYVCCDGSIGPYNICGCGGSTIRQVWFRSRKEEKR